MGGGSKHNLSHERLVPRGWGGTVTTHKQRWCWQRGWGSPAGGRSDNGGEGGASGEHPQAATVTTAVTGGVVTSSDHLQMLAEAASLREGTCAPHPVFLPTHHL